MNNIDTLSDKIIDGLYRDLMDLMDETVSYLNGEAKRLRKSLSVIDKLNFTLNTYNIGSIQRSSITWILAYKGYRAGEISKEELLRDYPISETPEVAHNKVDSLAPFLARTMSIRGLVGRHISNIGV